MGQDVAAALPTPTPPVGSPDTISKLAEADGEEDEEKGEEKEKSENPFRKSFRKFFEKK